MFTEEKAKGEVKELDAASKLLLEAANLLERTGWCQGNAHGRNGSVCMFGAIRSVADYGPTRDVAEDRVNRTLGMFMAAWNDKKDRTKEEVIAKLRAVAFSS